MSNSRRFSSSLRIEALENRIAPAGLVLVDYDSTAGTLTLVGDNLSNNVTLYPSGAGTHRLESSGSVLSTGGTFLDLGKLTTVTFKGEGSADRLELVDLSLQSVTFDGGGGDDQFRAVNLTTKESVELDLAGVDSAEFDGLATTIGGDLKVIASGGGDVYLRAQKTIVAGSILGANSGGSLRVRAEGAGSLAIKRGVAATSGLGEVRLEFESLGPAVIGKLPTGQSILLAGGAGHDEIRFNSGNVSLAGGIEISGTGGLKSIVSFAERSNLTIGKSPSGHSLQLTGTAEGEILLQALNIKLAGAIEMIANGAEDRITIKAPVGKAIIGKLPSGHSVRLTGGDADDRISIEASDANLAGGIELAGGAGFNELEIAGANGTAKIGKIASGASLLLTGGSLGATIASTVGNLVLGGGIDFAGGGGNGSVEIGATNTRATIGKLGTGESIKLQGGSGSDALTFGGASATLAGGIYFEAMEGSNSISLGSESTSLKIGKLKTTQSLYYSGGDSSDSILARSPYLTLAGGILFNAGHGGNSVQFEDPTAVTIGATQGGASLTFNGGSGSDLIVITGEQFRAKGSMEFNAGSGFNNINLFEVNATLGKNADGASLIYTGGSGSDQIDANDSLTMAGAFNFAGGDGSNRVLMMAMDALAIKGPVLYVGGAADDEFSIHDSNLRLGSSLTFEGGGGSDSFRCRANGSIAGDVTVNMGIANAGMRYADLHSVAGRARGLVIGGDLALAAQGVASEYWYLTDLVVRGELSATLGAGFSEFGANNFTVGGALTVDTGEGNDFVGLDQSNEPGGSMVMKIATILMQGGNDTLLIGSDLTSANPPFPDPSRVRFLAGLTVDGGPGTDTRNAFENENDFPGGAPTGLETFE